MKYPDTQAGRALIERLEALGVDPEKNRKGDHTYGIKLFVTVTFEVLLDGLATMLQDSETMILVPLAADIAKTPVVAKILRDNWADDDPLIYEYERGLWWLEHYLIPSAR